MAMAVACLLAPQRALLSLAPAVGPLAPAVGPRAPRRIVASASSPLDQPRAAALSRASASLLPIVDAALVEKVKKDIWRTAAMDISPSMTEEQSQALSTVLGLLARLVEERAAVVESPADDLSKLTLKELKERAAALGVVEPQGNKRLKRNWIDAISRAAERHSTEGMEEDLPEEVLNKAIAPYLPVLMLHGFPKLLRGALAGVKTSAQLSAVRQLNNYMIEVIRQMENKVVEMQWKQQEKLRDLCSAAIEGGTEQLMETAKAMRDDLDTDFCNYLNFAIEQEETRLREAGIEPARVRARAHSVDPSPAPLTSQDEGRASGASSQPAVWSEEPEPPTAGEVSAQQWLLVLQLVRQGTYSLLAKDYDEDVKLIRYIIGLKSQEARQELTFQSLLEMKDRDHFIDTVNRICSNLSVQRNAQDVEMYNSVLEIKTFIDGFERPYGTNDFSAL